MFQDGQLVLARLKERASCEWTIPELLEEVDRIEDYVGMIQVLDTIQHNLGIEFGQSFYTREHNLLRESLATYFPHWLEHFNTQLEIHIKSQAPLVMIERQLADISQRIRNLPADAAGMKNWLEILKIHENILTPHKFSVTRSNLFRQEIANPAHIKFRHLLPIQATTLTYLLSTFQECAKTELIKVLASTNSDPIDNEAIVSINSLL